MLENTPVMLENIPAPWIRHGHVSTLWILWRLCKNGLGLRATFLMDQMDEKHNARRPKNDNRK